MNTLKRLVSNTEHSSMKLVYVKVVSDITEGRFQALHLSGSQASHSTDTVTCASRGPPQTRHSPHRRRSRSPSSSATATVHTSRGANTNVKTPETLQAAGAVRALPPPYPLGPLSFKSIYPAAPRPAHRGAAGRLAGPAVCLMCATRVWVPAR